MQETIIIIGGLSAGPSAAAKARRLSENAKIILFEKTRYISYATCGIPYSLSGAIKDREKLMVVKPDLLTQRFNIDVRLEEEVLEIIPEEKKVRTSHGDYSYDKLVYATGSSPFIPPIKNLFEARNWSNCRTIEDFDKMMEDGVVSEKQSITVLGAGLIGMEVSENLIESGKQVNLVELAPQVLPPWDSKFADLAESVIKSHGVKVYKGTTISSIRLKGDEIYEVVLGNGEVLKTDYLIFGLGGRPNTQMLTSKGADHLPNGALLVNEKMETSLPDIYAAGDCVSIKNLITGKHDYFPMGTHSNKGGRTAGANAVGGNESFKGAYGTAIVKVFDYTLARTGMNPVTLEKAGIPYDSTLIVAGCSAGFYPGSKDMIIEIYYHKETGQLLGAEAFGEKGIDKRIDVYSTAIYAKLSVEDLPNLDLAYAPMYSPAKDAVIVSGFVAGNKRKKACDDISANGLESFMQLNSEVAYTLVDVRNPQEIATEGMIPYAVNLPLDQLRDRLSELPTDKPLITYCARGLRGYLAARILLNHGFGEVRNLSGGFKTWAQLNMPIVHEAVES